MFVVGEHGGRMVSAPTDAGERGARRQAGGYHPPVETRVRVNGEQ